MLKKGENLTIFPESTRSRNGRIDTSDYLYSVGRFVQRHVYHHWNLPLKILCI